jgi:hypothetical protein
MSLSNDWRVARKWAAADDSAAAAAQRSARGTLVAINQIFLHASSAYLLEVNDLACALISTGEAMIIARIGKERPNLRYWTQLSTY